MERYIFRVLISPCLPQIQEVERSFCQSLQKNFLETCNSLLSGQWPELYPDLIKSTLFTLPASDPTLLATTLEGGEDLKDVGPPEHEAASFRSEQDQVADSGTSNLANHDRRTMELVNKLITVPDPPRGYSICWCL